METEKIHNKGSARLFSHSLLELLTKTHPLIIWGMYTPIIVLFVIHSVHILPISQPGIICIFISGFLLWTLFEYLIHRYLFHYMASTPSGKRIIYILHGNHHEYPRDKTRLFMPPLPSLIIALITFIMQYALLRQYTFAFFPGFILGYLTYASMHYAIHALKPPFHWLKPLWRYHHLHHYLDNNKGFGVSTTLWDQVFRTTFNEADYKGRTKV